MLFELASGPPAVSESRVIRVLACEVGGYRAHIRKEAMSGCRSSRTVSPPSEAADGIRNGGEPPPAVVMMFSASIPGTGEEVTVRVQRRGCWSPLHSYSLSLSPPPPLSSQWTTPFVLVRRLRMIRRIPPSLFT